MLLTVNCDDFGMHPDINAAIVTLLQTSPRVRASLMPVGCFFEDAVERLRQLGLSNCGVHLALNSEYPGLPTRSLSPAPSLTSPTGSFYADVKDLRERASLTEIERELRLQIARVERAGLKITHLDTHMFFSEPQEWGNDQVEKLLLQLAHSLRVPLRTSTSAARVFVWQEAPTRTERFRFYQEHLTHLPAQDTEFIIHPAQSAERLRSFTRSASWRSLDFEFFSALDWSQLRFAATPPGSNA